jgi:hypothetical protein
LSNPVSPAISIDDSGDRRFSIGANAATPPTVPPARRSMATAVRGGPSSQADSRDHGDEAPPPLPSRTGTGLSGKSSNGRALMDETDEHSMNGLSGWEVLKPA